MTRRNLSNNKKAMLALKYMARCGLSNQKISAELNTVFGHFWSPSTIGRRIRLLETGMSRSCSVASPPPPLPSPTRKALPPQTTEAILSKHFRDVDPEDLSFGELCNYTASFFERLANHPKKTKAPQEWWDSARDKVVLWRRILKRRPQTPRAVDSLDKVQMRAYEYCMELYNVSAGSKNNYFEVYALYRAWRVCFVASIFGIKID